MFFLGVPAKPDADLDELKKRIPDRVAVLANPRVAN
jgi:hypothetical protein